jgi:anti-sigma regulatory factor (Ser/Thr protein kinase)
MNSKLEYFVLEIPPVINDYKILIDKCCQYIIDVSEISADFKRLAKFKLVIMELLTNAMKHHSLASSFIEILKIDTQLVVRKVDNGEIFSFIDAETLEIYEFPLNFLKSEKLVVGLMGRNYALSLMLKSITKVEFLNIIDLSYESVFDIPENFGLKIIRQCSDSFHYYYDNETNQNVFEVTFER